MWVLYKSIQNFNIVLNFFLFLINVHLRFLRRYFYFTLFAELAGIIQHSFPKRSHADYRIDRFFGVADLVLHTVPILILRYDWELLMVFWFDCIFISSWHEYIKVVLLIISANLYCGLFYSSWGWMVYVLIFYRKFV